LSDPVTAEVRPLVRALNRLFEQLTHQIDGERRFTADAAHELRTPIAAIRMQAQVARGAQQDPERQVALDAVLQACDRATRLVAQLLQLARLDADPATRNEVGCDAVLETQAILAELGPQALAKQQTLSLDAPASLPLAMPPEWVGVLVGNLVDNAERYSPVGAQIQVAWLSSGSATQLVVQDSGPGLSDADLARLGDRFFRVPGNGAPGSGLGWSIVQRLAERYHLQLAVDRSLALGGLRVQLTWPETMPQDAAPQP
jgi:two-component system sensor histidine kinase QseC